MRHENAHENDARGGEGYGSDGSVTDAAKRQAMVAGQAVRSAGVALIDAETVLGDRCSTCDGFMCMDCAEGVDHEKCTRTCVDCVLEYVDWDEDLAMTSIIGELAGLCALDEAIAALDDEAGQDEGGRNIAS